MDGVEGKAGGVCNGLNPLDSSKKISLVPFAQDQPPVHLLDGDGNASSARERSPEDDFQLAAQRLGVTPADEQLPPEEPGGQSHRQPGDSGVREAEKADVGRDGSGATPETASPPEHPLQKAITSFDMALGELNQLVHLVDLARVGQFMVLERVTPSEEDQTRSLPDQTTKHGEGVPRDALSTMVSLKRTQLKGAAEQLRKRAKRLRETTTVQRAFQQGVVHLRKSWRIVAPNHGKVNVPLQVGEALCVDCSFGSAGGKSVPLTAAVGSRHRHPWLLQLTCGQGGRLAAQPSNTQLKAFEIQLVSDVTGECEHSLRANFPARNDRSDGADTTQENEQGPPSTRESGRMPAVGGSGGIQMDELEQQISRHQHSVFWEEVFDILKAEALVDGKDGWLAHQDARCDYEVDGDRKEAGSPGAVRRTQVGKKRRLVSSNPQATGASARNTGAYVAHVLDDEVLVEMDSRYLLGFRLVSGESASRGSSGVCSASGLCTEQGISEGSDEQQSASICQLALLYCGGLIRQQQRARGISGWEFDAKRGARPELGAPIPAGPAGGKARDGRTGRQSPIASTWKSVRRVLLHHLFRSEVVERLANVSRSLRSIGLALAVRWTHLEETCPSSAVSFTLGHCFHFRASLSDGCGVIVSALPGLQNHADQRSVELQSARDLEHFLLGEVCRQIVLTFGDITAGWKSGSKPKGTPCFRVDLVPAAIHLLPGSRSKAPCNGASEATDGSSCEVRVFVDEVGVKIACSRWAATQLSSNGRHPAIDSEASASWDSGSAWTGVTVADWDRLEGPDVFRKFSSLLEKWYPM